MLSQFFPVEESINCLENEVLVHKSAYLSSMGWHGIYSICFSQLDGDKILSYWMGDFLSLSLSD